MVQVLNGGHYDITGMNPSNIVEVGMARIIKNASILHIQTPFHGASGAKTKLGMGGEGCILKAPCHKGKVVQLTY